MTNADILRQKVKSNEIVRVGGAFDAMSAKLVEMHGFDAVWAGSFAISATHALPDASIMTMTEFLHVTTSMVDACKIPVIADCDTGFGGPSNVSHMVKKYEAAGVAAISIEDKIFPKQNSLLDGGKQELISEKEFVAKIIAAKEAKRNPNFMIIARTEALIAESGMNEAVQRARAYEKAGADALLIHSKKNTPDEVFEFADIWDGKLPVVIVPTSYPSIKSSDLQKHKIKMIIYANQTLRASYASMNRVLEQIRNSDSLDSVKEEISTMEEIFKLQKMYELKNEEEMIKQNLKKMGYIS
ncbi:isocitrate lyase/phosphoenolpyruvate mutase family protein [Candidatus Nitrosotenuis sp. DW1]|uniref:isocitrate lyase/phosphoenolpyruvate mutase family protein n=1 Tax=Candidatus Nitrosotenuis sp. DW1 TaxID=2259672 RepID=UPI0015C80591|nr:isocitrate lyase/phosphoenolpyruvate mutase family protein [Candidatus Nitrosotenuis sp. DW1]QLH09674.1 phosphoenolpyruvate phosphomutase [Candidatus Nitrosotenuis sp. DW1]